ncbi:ScyD/ScyE family protein [Christiangramia gaetbulicola]|nr:ScyD/ScyE family protein [Christiangramia gaetbulicola]
MFTSCSPEPGLGELPSEYLVNASAKLSEPGEPELFLSGFQGASGSTIGPGGDLFVTEGATGTISRVDLKTGDISTFATGLPPSIIGIGGANDIVFIDDTAYVIVTLVGPQFGTEDIVGIYRIDGPETFTVIADIGAFSVENPPKTDFFVTMGVQYSIEFYRGGFLVADGHHNRVLEVTTEGDISVFQEFGNIVPTGLDVLGHTVYMAEAGPVPHNPEDGKVVAFGPNSSDVTTIASGARLLVDVEFGRGRSLFALSQGIWNEEGEGSPAFPDTGSLVQVQDDGTFSIVADGLDRPTSMEIVHNKAYIVTLMGDIWTVDNISAPPYGKN